MFSYRQINVVVVVVVVVLLLLLLLLVIIIIIIIKNNPEIQLTAEEPIRKCVISLPYNNIPQIYYIITILRLQNLTFKKAKLNCQKNRTEHYNYKTEI